MEISKLMFSMIAISIFIFLTFGFLNSIGSSYDMTASEDFQVLYNTSEATFSDLNQTIGQTEGRFSESAPVIQTLVFITENAVLAGKTLTAGLSLVQTFFTTLAGIFGLPPYIITAIMLIVALIGIIALIRLLSGGVRF